MKTFYKVTDIIYFIIQKIALVLLAAVMTLLFVQTVLRFTLGISLSWAEELCRYMTIWMTLLASGIGIRKEIHVGFDLLKNKLPKKLKNKLLILINAVVFAFSFLLLTEGYKLVQQTRMQTSSSLGFSMAYVYSSLVVGAILIAIFSAEAVLQRVVKDRC